MITTHAVTCPICNGRGVVPPRSQDDQLQDTCTTCKGEGEVIRCKSTTKAFKARSGDSIRCDLHQGHEGKHRRNMTWDDQGAIGKSPRYRPGVKKPQASRRLSCG